MGEEVSIADVVKELELEKVRTTILNLKVLLMEYNMILPRLRVRDFKEIALKNIKKMLAEIQATSWPAEMKEQVKGLESLLERLLEPIKSEDYTRFQPLHNAVKRNFELIEEKFMGIKSQN